MKKALSRAAGLLIALILAFPLLPVTSKAADTILADYPVGTVFKIKEDGTYQEWILIDHNYNGVIGNQLLMRKNTIAYTPLAYTGGSSGYRAYLSSPTANYLDNTYTEIFVSSLQSSLKSVDVTTYGNGNTTNAKYKCFILSCYEVTGSAYASYKDGAIPTGKYIAYFNTIANRGSDQDYSLRDGDFANTYKYGPGSGTYILTSGSSASTSCDRFGNPVSMPANYRPCIVLPSTLVVGTGNTIDGIITPSTPTVSVSSTWATSNTATLSAASATHYAVTTTNTPPSTGWQTSNSFTLTANGTYYAWARSATNTVSASRSFSVSKADRSMPVVSSVAVPDSWHTSSTVTVSGTDTGSGIAAYTVTTGGTSPPISGWQTSNSFSFSANGSYNAWIKDNAGNVSVGYSFEITKVDTTAPVISEVDMPTDWVAQADIDIQATDAGSGITGYALTTSGMVPVSDWQDSNNFTLAANGTYYAWVRDGAGNTTSQYIYFNKIDSDPPSISFVTVPTTWAATSSITISAFDSSSGVTAYVVTTTATPPVTGWQAGKTLELTENGTYYAFARDGVGHVSEGYEFTVSKVDSIKPLVSAVTIPEDWGTSAKVTLAATDDGGSSLSTYAISNTATPPGSGWQVGTSFTLTTNGNYFSFAKDGAGNVSEAYAFEIGKVDTTRPIVESVTVPDSWGMTSTVTVNASDTGSGVAAYAITTGGTSAPVAGWQSNASFTFSAKGTYYAWVRDGAGNVSLGGVEFEIGKIDSTPPVISEVTMPADWTSAAKITVMAADTETGITGYAVTTSSAAPAADAWQESDSFTLYKNGTFYVWAKDGAGNTASKNIYISKVDVTPPEITSIRYNNANTVVTVSGTDAGSGIKGIYINGIASDGGYTPYQIPDGTRYLTLYAEDKAGNKSAEQTERVPGWFDVFDTLTVETVTFDPEIKTATIKAATTKTAIAGIYVNGKLLAGNPVTYTINSAQYVEMQVVDVNGDRSAVYRQRVPGWAEQVSTLTITECEFSYDNTTAVITAAETPAEGSEARGITGIEVNGEFFRGNPVAYDIPEGTRHLEMRAYNTDGDYSPLLIRRVPGWSEIVSTITISSIEFSDYNTRATITALATGGDSIAGIFVNEEYFAGNPVVYKIGKDVDTLHVQAVNPNGDLSAMVNKAVPKSTVKSTLKLTIEAPEWTSANRTKVKITASDSIGLKAIMAKTGEDDDWTDVTSSRYIWISEDTTVYASVENDDGTAKETSLDIVCFDRAAPTVTAAQQEKVVNIRAEDKKSGVKAIYVNNVEYSGSKIYGGNLTYSIPEGTTTVAVKAVDEAGNASETLELPVRTTVTAVPGIIAPSQPAPVAPPPDPEPAAIPDPEPEPEPEPEPQPEPQPEPEPQEEPKAAGMTQGQMAGLAAGAFTISSAGTAGALWWLRRKRLMAEAVPDFDPNYKKVWDESEFHGTKDPLDKGNVTEVEFNRRIS